jgi:hypothetical protein
LTPQWLFEPTVLERAVGGYFVLMLTLSIAIGVAADDINRKPAVRNKNGIGQCTVG